MAVRSKSWVTRDTVNSAALYVYCKNYSPDTAPEKVYNEWLAASGLTFPNLGDAAMMLEKISGYLQVPREDMRFALQQEHLL